MKATDSDTHIGAWVGARQAGPLVYCVSKGPRVLHTMLSLITRMAYSGERLMPRCTERLIVATCLVAVPILCARVNPDILVMKTLFRFRSLVVMTGFLVMAMPMNAEPPHAAEILQATGIDSGRHGLLHRNKLWGGGPPV